MTNLAKLKNRVIGLQECLGIVSEEEERQAFIWMADDVLILINNDYMVLGSNSESFGEKKASAHEKGVSSSLPSLTVCSLR